jgi:tyrosinase
MTGEPTLAKGRCVDTGPFANRTFHWQAHADAHAHKYNISHNPHCLSRGFATDSFQTRFQEQVKPERLENALQQDGYDNFFSKLEFGPHNAIPQFISGDFYYFTAPNGE